MIAAEKMKLGIQRFPSAEIRAALIEFWETSMSARQVDPFSKKPTQKGTLYELLPALDSLTMVRSFIVVGKLLNMKIPVRLVKRGGYDSRDAMLKDLLPKLQKEYDKRINPQLT